MQQYLFSDIGKRREKKIILLSILGTLIAMSVVFIVTFWKSGYYDLTTWISEMGYYMLAMFAIGIITSLVCYKYIMSMIESFVITLTDNSITREVKFMRTRTIQYEDIVQISSTRKGVLVVSGKDSVGTIMVSPYIANYAELKNRLNDISPITAYVAKPGQWFLIVLFYIFIACGLYYQFGQNETLLLAAQVLTAASLTTVFIYLQVSKRFNKRTKKIAWYVLLFMALGFAVNIINWIKSF